MSNPPRQPSSGPTPPKSATPPPPSKAATQSSAGAPQRPAAASQRVATTLGAAKRAPGSSALRQPASPPPAKPRQVPVAPTRAGSPSLFDKPLLSTIDRYVLSSFVKNYLISLLVLIGLYVVLDMVFNFDEFVKVSGPQAADAEPTSAWHTAYTILDFYFFQSFRVFNHLAGLIPVVATAFTLVRMSRFNELAALLAAGVPLRRVAQPIIIASLLVNGLLLMVNQEIVVPSMIDKLTRDRGEADSHLEGRYLEAMPVGENDTLFASRYTLPREDQPATMDRLYILQKQPNVSVTQLSAERAVYDAAQNRWNLTDGHRTIIPNDPARTTTIEPVDTYSGDVNPETIGLFVARGDFVDLLSYNRISELLRQNTSVGRLDLLRVRDARLAAYVLNGVLVLLTIPCVLTREPTQLRTAATRVFILIGACLATIFITQNLAGQPAPNPSLANTWPAIMAWLPIFLFLPIAIWLLDRLKT